VCLHARGAMGNSVRICWQFNCDQVSRKLFKIDQLLPKVSSEAKVYILPLFSGHSIHLDAIKKNFLKMWNLETSLLLLKIQTYHCI